MKHQCFITVSCCLQWCFYLSENYAILQTVVLGTTQCRNTRIYKNIVNPFGYVCVLVNHSIPLQTTVVGGGTSKGDEPCLFVWQSKGMGWTFTSVHHVSWQPVPTLNGDWRTTSSRSWYLSTWLGSHHHLWTRRRGGWINSLHSNYSVIGVAQLSQLLLTVV